jgi:methylenetetrahydrofolate--tRNA-(uracil-5-)-methyltransferase
MQRDAATVVGGGLAGCEAAWQLARRGLRAALVEMKPVEVSPAHATPLLAEIVCSNSLRSDDPETPAGLLKAELRAAGSIIIACADATRVPAGEALAVDRRAFSLLVTARLASHPRVRLERRGVRGFDYPGGPAGLPVIMATGPLTGSALASRLRTLCGRGLYFYDAIAPIVDAETIDWSRAFRASRWASNEPGAPDGDYVNCPMDRETYAAFVAEVKAGRKVLPHSFEEPRYFEGCLPIEVMADRGLEVLSHGPMRPVGLVDPATGRRPHAVVQLRSENRWNSAYNLVGFQTRLAYPEQKRIFRMIPALANAEFVRFGSIHRNAYVEGPRVLGPELELRALPQVRLAGQITGVEGYIESTAMGLLCARFLGARLAGRVAPPPPPTTAMGALHHHATAPRPEGARFDPMNINYGLFPPIAERHKKQDRRRLVRERAEGALGAWLSA